MNFNRVLLIGNSHLAAIRTALRDAPERWADFRPDIFGLPGRSVGELVLRDGILQSADPEIRRQINFYNNVPHLEIRSYDAFVVVGGSSFGQICGIQNSHRSLYFPSVQAGVVCDLCSEGFMDAMLTRRIQASTGLKLISKLAGLGQAPILFVPGPLPSYECQTPPGGEPALVALAKRGDGPVFYQRYRDRLHHEAEDLAVILEQPLDTIIADVFTHPDWMRGSLRLNSRQDVRHGQREYAHANARYGARQIDQIIAALDAL